MWLTAINLSVSACNALMNPTKMAESIIHWFGALTCVAQQTMY